MNKHLLALFIATVFYAQSVAQITITNADMLSVNDTFRLSSTVDTWSIDPTLTGANWTWDYSFLTANSQDVDTAVSVGSTPFLYQVYFNNAFVYPAWKADYAIAGIGFTVTTFSVSDVYDYFKKSSSKYQNVGFGATISGIPTSVRKNPIEDIYHFPMNYSDSFSNHSEYEFDIPSVMEYKQKMDKDAVVDGWGTVITPYGTFNCLRVAYTLNITDSINFDAVGFPIVTPRPESYEYHYVAAGQDVPVVKLTATTGNVVTNIDYKDFYIPNVGVAETKSKINMTMFPNPATDVVYFNTDVILKTLIVFDAFGREVFSTNVNDSRYALNINNWSNGVYFVEVRNLNGVKREKLIVQR